MTSNSKGRATKVIGISPQKREIGVCFYIKKKSKKMLFILPLSSNYGLNECLRDKN